MHRMKLSWDLALHIQNNKQSFLFCKADTCLHKLQIKPKFFINMLWMDIDFSCIKHWDLQNPAFLFYKVLKFHKAISRTSEGKWKPVGGLWKSVSDKSVCEKAAEEKPPSPKSILYMMPSKGPKWQQRSSEPAQNMSTQNWSRMISHRMGFSYLSGSSTLRVGTGVQSPYSMFRDVQTHDRTARCSWFVSCKPNLLQTKFAAPKSGTDSTDEWDSPKPSRAVRPLDVLQGQPQLQCEGLTIRSPAVAATLLLC